MTPGNSHHAATPDGLTISPALDFVVEASQVPPRVTVVDRRVVWLCGVSIGLGFVTAFVAQALVALIALITNLAFFGRISLEEISPAGNNLGLLVIMVPVIGAIVIGFMARYGSKAIRGHGIPEAMEQVLTNQSRIPARITFLKPTSAAISIGTGGPFGAEGPIIATGGALGSLIGQLTRVSSAERKTLLAVGAAAGMAATFGSPVSAVLLAIELLLFEFSARSIVPVALGAATATGMRVMLVGADPVFPMPDLAPPELGALAFYAVLGGVMGVAAAGVTRIVYAIEDAFERLPLHWMWWPTLGAVVVGVVGYFSPRTLGVGYDNITAILSSEWSVATVGALCLMKFISWSISLGSGTSGGTLAPLFTIGGGLGAVLGAAAAAFLPGLGVDVRVAALVGMAALFAGASRALLASTVFAFETTLQPFGLLPLLGGCTASYLVSALLMKHTIMTEKIARRGIFAPHEYTADLLAQFRVCDVATEDVVTLSEKQSIQEVRDWLRSDRNKSHHQGFPVLSATGSLIGVLTRRDILDSPDQPNQPIGQLISRLPKFVYDDCTVRQAADHMVNHAIGRLPVLSRAKPHHIVGIVTRSDILSVFQRHLDETTREAPVFKLPRLRKRD